MQLGKASALCGALRVPLGLANRGLPLAWLGFTPALIISPFEKNGDLNFGGLFSCGSAASDAPSGVFLDEIFLGKNVLNLRYLVLL